MGGDPDKIIVGSEEGQIVPNADLSQNRIDGAHLNAPTAAAIPNLGGFDVVLSIGWEKRDGAEPLDDF